MDGRSLRANERGSTFPGPEAGFHLSIRRNTVYNLAGALLPLPISLLTVPAYISVVGEERFGVLAIAWLLLGYFGLFDLGLSRATAQRIAAQRDSEPQARAETFWTALVLNAGFGALGGVLIWPVAYFIFSYHIKVSEQIRPEIIASIPWLLIAVPVATISGVLSGALQGRERFLTLNFISVVGTVLFQVLPLLVARTFSPALTWVLPVVLLIRVVSLALLLWQCQRHLPLAVAPRINRALIGPLFRFGGWVTLTSVVGPLMVVLDRFVIGALVGAKAVTYYTVPYNLSSTATLLPASLAAALFPRLSSRETLDHERLAEESIRVLAVLMTPLVIIGLFTMEPFLTWWLSDSFAQNAAPVGQILLVGMWSNCFALIPYTRLQAKGRPDLVAKLHLLELPLYLAALYFASTSWGVVGAAVAWSLRAATDCVLLFALGGARTKTAREFLFPAAHLAFAMFAILAVPERGGLVWWLSGIGILAISCSWGWRNAPAPLMAALSSTGRVGSNADRADQSERDEL